MMSKTPLTPAPKPASPMYKFTLTDSGVIVDKHNSLTGYYQPLEHTFRTLGAAIKDYNPLLLQDETYSARTGDISVRIDPNYTVRSQF